MNSNIHLRKISLSAYSHSGSTGGLDRCFLAVPIENFGNTRYYAKVEPAGSRDGGEIRCKDTSVTGQGAIVVGGIENYFFRHKKQDAPLNRSTRNPGGLFLSSADSM